MVTFASIQSYSYLSRYDVVYFFTQTAIQTVLLILFLTFLFQSYDGCETWSEMQAQLCQQLATLYEEHKHVYGNLINSQLNTSRFDQINSGVLKDGITKNALFYLSKYLKDYHRNKCIVLIDEYDHPLDVAYRYQYYEKARGFFASLFGTLLKVSTYFRLSSYHRIVQILN